MIHEESHREREEKGDNPEEACGCNVIIISCSLLFMSMYVCLEYYFLCFSYIECMCNVWYVCYNGMQYVNCVSLSSCVAISGQFE